MVRILTTVALLLATGLGVQAAENCQCLFQDGSHCCVQSDTRGGSVSCTDACRNAVRYSDGTSCNAGGKWSKVSAWNAQWRAGCRR